MENQQYLGDVTTQAPGSWSHLDTPRQKYSSWPAHARLAYTILVTS